MSEIFDLEGEKAWALAELNTLKAGFKDTDQKYGFLDELIVKIEDDKIGNRKESFSMKIGLVPLRIFSSDDLKTVFTKLKAFIELVVKARSPEIVTAVPAVAIQTGEVKGEVDSVVEALVPGKDKTYWRDVNVEIVKIRNAFKGTDLEQKMADLRKKSHSRNLGEEDFSLVIGGDVLEIWAGETEDKILVKLAVFLNAVKKHHLGQFLAEEKIANLVPPAPDKIFWRDVVSGIDGLVKSYPDEKYKTLNTLREMLENGEVGMGMHLLLSVGAVHLWIKKTDNEDLIKEKIAVFIGELKQLASMAANAKPTQTPLDPLLEKTYWRDIEGALHELETAYGENSDFKLLKMSIERGILGTVKDLHLVIDGVRLEIVQSDTDQEMRDKLSEFIRQLTKNGEVKINDGVRQKYSKLEAEYRKIESEKRGLEESYQQLEGRAKGAVKRLTDQNSQYEAEIRRLQAELARKAPAPQSYRSHSG